MVENKREKMLVVPMSDSEMSVIKNEAAKLGMTVTSFIRLLIKNWTDGITFERK